LFRGAAGILVGGAFFLFHRPVPGIIAASLGLIILIAALCAPRGLQRFFERSAETVGTVLAVVVLTPVYLLLFVPFGLLFRSGRRDRLQRSADQEAPTYWRQRATGESTKSAGSSFDRQF